MTTTGSMLEVFVMMRYNLLKPMTRLGPFCGLFVSNEQSPVVTVIAGSTLIINMITSYLYLYFNLGDIDEFVKGILTISLYTSGVTCLTLCALKRKTYTKVLKEVISEFDAEFENASKSAKQHMLATNISLMVVVLLMCSIFVSYVVDPFVSENIFFITPAWYPFDTHNPIGFATVFIIQLFGSSFAGFLTVLTGIYFSNVMEQTCLHFENLCTSLSMRLKVEGKIPKYSSENNVEKSLHVYLKKFIDRHNQLLRRIKIVNDVFSLFFLIYYLTLVPIVSAAALEFVSSEKAESTSFYMKNVSVVAVGIVLLHAPCKCGSRIVTAQNNVIQALYSQDYFLFSESIKRTLSIINLRAQVPNIITTGGIVSFDMVAYGQALGLFYSIFTLLHHFQTAQKA